MKDEDGAILAGETAETTRVFEWHPIREKDNVKDESSFLFNRSPRCTPQQSSVRSPLTVPNSSNHERNLASQHSISIFLVEKSVLVLEF